MTSGYIERRVGESRIIRGKPTRPRATYTVRVRVGIADGGPRRETHGTYDLERDAKDKLTAVLDGYRTGTWRRPSTLTVRELGARWLREGAGDKAPNTRRHHESNLTHHVYQSLGDRLAAQLSPAEVATWQVEQLEHGRHDGAGVSPKSLADYRGTLHAMYAWAAALGIVQANPVAATPSPRRHRTHPDAPTIAEVQAFVRALASAPRLQWPVFLLAATGMRRGELLATRWRDATLERYDDPETGAERYRGRFRIHPDRGNLTGSTRATLAFGPAKTKTSARVVELPEYAVARLLRYRDEQAARFLVAGIPWTPDALVCSGGAGQPIVPDGLTHELARFRQRHHLERIHLHLLRHAVATAMLEAGASLEAVSEHLGHATIVTTADTYNHVRQCVLTEAAARYHESWSRTAAGDLGGVPRGNRPQIDPNRDTEADTVDELAARRARRLPA